MERIWEWIKRVSALWGALSALALFLGFFGWFPYYEIIYKKKWDITPRTYMFPGQNIRLSAEFVRAVELPEIERVRWSGVDSSGGNYGNLPDGTEIDVQLLPDYSGIVTIRVSAKLRGESTERSGAGSIHIVQTTPQRIHLNRIQVPLPLEKEQMDLNTLEIYAGSNHWLSLSSAAVTKKQDSLLLEGTPLAVWGGKAFLRYKTAENPAGPYKYHALTAMRPMDPS